MMCGTRLFPITFDLAQLMLRQVRVCPNGYGAMNGHAETNVHQRHDRQAIKRTFDYLSA
jgi:hypothetical protein